MNEYERWLSLAKEDADLVRELEEISDDPAAQRDRFFSELSFGTGGLRGVIGAGTNRMNIYTVSRATHGLFDVISARARGAQPVFVIAHDTRIKSDLFARRAAQVLSSRGAKVYLYEEPTPVPLLSYATRHLACDAGICITASHNPAIYNGYKVYAANGGQLLAEDAGKVLHAAEEYDYFTPLDDAGAGEILPGPQSVIEDYFASLYDHRLPVAQDASLSVVYTPLNGTGLCFVPRALASLGFSDVSLVPEQAKHDGSFATCPRPNPEMPEALKLAVDLAKEKKADLVLATDPDCDRVGIAAPDASGEYRLFTGNETGVLLLEYLARTRTQNGTMQDKPIVCTTVVSTEMANPIAKEYGLELTRVLTGFKYIGELINHLCETNDEGRFFFGFEESYGYLASTEVRDKDACEASTLICQMARAYKAQGISLCEALTALYEKYGYYQNKLCNFEFFGEDGAKKRTQIMETLRSHPPLALAGFQILATGDYLSLKRTEAGKTEDIHLPREDMLSFELEGGSKLVIRPSGTEPKIKIYLFSRGETMDAAQETLSRLEASLQSVIGA